MSFIQNLDWRYATKKFDTNKKVSENDLNTILESIRKTPTSFGLMPFRVVVIQNQELKNTLKTASWNQAQIDACSDLLVFVARKDLWQASEEFFQELSAGDADTRAKLAGYEATVKTYAENMGEENFENYSANQAFIALGFAMAAAAELQIDSCAIGGFEPAKYQEILNLSENEVPCVVLAVGYRAEDENPRQKFRLSKETVFSFVK